MENEVLPNDFTTTVNDIKLAILKARARAAQAANAEVLKLYFFVGGYISKKTRKAKWGTGAINALSERLQVELPGLRGFSASSIKRMRVFFERWVEDASIRPMALGELAQPSPIPLQQSTPNDLSDIEAKTYPNRPTALGDSDTDAAVAAFLSIGFSHHCSILEKTGTSDERWYYILAAAKGNWSHSELMNHLRADDYHRIGELPNNFEKTLSPMMQATKAVRSFKDEYLLELVNLDNVDAIHDQDLDERILSKALVANVEKTIQALGGNDFCFMGREKRLVIENEELFIDLLFYHRTLRAMIAIELKMGKFRASYLGQLSLYLSALDKLEKKPDENPSVGLLLCEKMNKPFVQLAVQGYSQPIGIATYQALRNIPEPYKTLAPVIDGVRRVLEESAAEKKAGNAMT